MLSLFILVAKWNYGGLSLKKYIFNIITSSVCFPVGIKTVSEVHVKPLILSNTKYSNRFQVNLLAVVSHPYPVFLICCLFSFLYRRCRKTGILSYLIVKIYPELPCHYPWGHLLPTTRTPLSLFKKCQTKVKEMLWKEPFKVSVSGHKLFSMVVFFLFCFSSPMWGSIQAMGALMIYTAIFWLTSIFRLLCALPEFWFLVSGFACYNLRISYLPPDNLRVIQEALLKFVGPNLTCLSVLYSTRLKKRLLFLNNFSLFTAIAQKRGGKKRGKKSF